MKEIGEYYNNRLCEKCLFSKWGWDSIAKTVRYGIDIADTKERIELLHFTICLFITGSIFVGELKPEN